MKSSNCFELDAVELFAQLFRRHGRRNDTTSEMSRNGTLVLRNSIAPLWVSHNWNVFKPDRVINHDPDKRHREVSAGDALLF
jgi:hypothetical protein